MKPGAYEHQRCKGACNFGSIQILINYVFPFLWHTICIMQFVTYYTLRVCSEAALEKDGSTPPTSTKRLEVSPTKKRHLQTKEMVELRHCLLSIEPLLSERRHLRAVRCPGIAKFIPLYCKLLAFSHSMQLG